MKEERSFKYTLILGICMLLSLLLIGKMLLSSPPNVQNPPHNNGITENHPTPTPQPEGDTQPMEIQLTENDMYTLITQASPIPLQDVKVTIGQSGSVSFCASVERQTLLDSNLDGSLRTAILFLPETCGLRGEWTAYIQDNALELDCQSAEIGGFTLPDSVSKALTEEITKVCNEAITRQNIQPSGIQFEDGFIRISTKP